MKKNLFLSFLGLSMIGSASDLASTRFDLTYTFNKTNIWNDSNLEITVQDQNDYVKKTVPFKWGNQVSFYYEAPLLPSLFKFCLSLQGVHNHGRYIHTVPANSLESIYIPTYSIQEGGSFFTSILINSSTVDQTYIQKNQFNFFDIEMDVKYLLKNSKHAEFSVFGGGIFGGYNHKISQKVTGLVNLNESPNLSLINAKQSSTNYILGPSIKIEALAKLLSNHLILSLKAGLGLMMDFNYQSYTSQFKTYTNLGFAGQTDDSYHSGNTFRFCPQADLEASIGFKNKGLTVSTGLNQFAIMEDISGNQIGSIVFGGPFIKASYEY
jgi:hypothetical protein